MGQAVVSDFYQYIKDWCLLFQQKEFAKKTHLTKKAVNKICDWFVENKLCVHFVEGRNQSYSVQGEIKI